MRVVLITKGCEIIEGKITVKSLDELYKKCGYKTNKDFKKINTWKVGASFYSIYGKDKGRHNNENKYELPPPVDNTLLFGKLLCIKHSGPLISMSNVMPLTKANWEEVYEKLFGGFEDLGDEDSYSEEEEIPEHLKTKDGYLKDGFVVSDESNNDSEYTVESDENNSEDEFDYDDEEFVEENSEEEYDNNEKDNSENEDKSSDDSEEEYSEEDSDDNEYYDDNSELSEEEYHE